MSLAPAAICHRKVIRDFELPPRLLAIRVHSRCQHECRGRTQIDDALSSNEGAASRFEAGSNS